MTTILDVAIGVMLLYLSLALIVTTLQELLASLFAARAQHLYRALSDLVTGTLKESDGEVKSLVQALYEHPLIRNLADRSPPWTLARPALFARGLPSYIPSRTFAVALIDVLRGTKAGGDAMGAGELLANARQVLDKVTDPELKRVLTLLIGDAERMASTLNERSQLVSERLETWFNDRMARVSGWYKRRAQAWSLGLALVVTVAFNADTIHLAQRLWDDSDLRAGVVAMAEAQTETPELRIELEATGLPLGWQLHGASHPKTALGHALRLVGWLLTSVAVSLGAAFWFDVLNRAIRLRGTGARTSVKTGRVALGAVETAP